jgi:small subunit ribosomal protein S17
MTQVKTSRKTAPAAAGGAGAAPARKIVTMTGVVRSDARAKTRTVAVNYTAKHPKYGKYIRHETVVHAHDEGNASKAGDTVEVGPCRPFSKTKTWRVLRIVSRGGE